MGIFSNLPSMIDTGMKSWDKIMSGESLLQSIGGAANIAGMGLGIAMDVFSSVGAAESSTENIRFLEGQIRDLNTQIPLIEEEAGVQTDIAEAGFSSDIESIVQQMSSGARDLREQVSQKYGASGFSYSGDIEREKENRTGDVLAAYESTYDKQTNQLGAVLTGIETSKNAQISQIEQTIKQYEHQIGQFKKTDMWYENLV